MQKALGGWNDLDFFARFGPEEHLDYDEFPAMFVAALLSSLERGGSDSWMEIVNIVNVGMRWPLQGLGLHDRYIAVGARDNCFNPDPAIHRCQP
jgi:hypothetical protein